MKPLPHAEVIRARRADTERGARAQKALSRIEPALAQLARGSGAEEAERLLEQLRTDWPQLDDELETYAALSEARLEMHKLVSRGESASREMHDLRHKQSDALRDDEWAEARQALGEIMDRRAAVAASYNPLAQSVAALDPLLDVLEEQVASATREATERPSLALARARSVQMAMTRVLDSLPVDFHVPALPDDPEAALGAVARTVSQVRDLATGLREERDLLAVELTELDRSMQERTG